MTSKLSAEEKRQRAKLFGTLRDGLRPLNPYRWNVDVEGSRGGLLEIPVTTMPIFKVPIHCSYVLYLSKLSVSLALSYFKLAMRLCRLTGIQPSLLLHPLDFLDYEDVKELSFFPAMQLPRTKKSRIVSDVLSIYTEQFNALSMQDYAREVEQTASFAVIEPSFRVGHTP
jgi:hypothetical protein